MMPLSPLSPPVPKLFLPNPLDQFTAVTDAMLRNPPRGDWLLWRRTYNDQGFSPLRQITRQNVDALHVAWAWTLPMAATRRRRWNMTACFSSPVGATTSRR